MTVPDSSGKNAGSCESSGINKPTARSCKMTNIMA